MLETESPDIYYIEMKKCQTTIHEWSDVRNLQENNTRVWKHQCVQSAELFLGRAFVLLLGV